MTARRLGWALLALLVGGAVGVGAAYGTRPGPDSSGVPSPVPAQSPSMPGDEPYADDIDYPALGTIEEFDTYRIGGAPQLQTWEYAIPEGWVPYEVTPLGDLAISVADVSDYIEVRFRPADERLVGGYSVRVEAINNHSPPADEIADRIADFQRLYEDVVILDQTENAVFLTYRTEEGDRLRYNFFQWFEAPDTDVASLEMSIVGRAEDESGLRSLFDQFAERAHPVPD